MKTRSGMGGTRARIRRLRVAPARPTGVHVGLVQAARAGRTRRPCRRTAWNSPMHGLALVPRVHQHPAVRVRKRHEAHHAAPRLRVSAAKAREARRRTQKRARSRTPGTARRWRPSRATDRPGSAPVPARRRTEWSLGVRPAAAARHAHGRPPKRVDAHRRPRRWSRMPPDSPDERRPRSPRPPRIPSAPRTQRRYRLVSVCSLTRAAVPTAPSRRY